MERSFEYGRLFIMVKGAEGECVEFKEGNSSVGKQIHGCAAAGTVDCVISYSYHPAVSCIFCVYEGKSAFITGL